MSKRLIASLIFTVLLLGLAPACRATVPTGTGLVEGNHVGNLAYDFSLQSPTGNTVTLSGLQGHPVILNFWSIE